ncbi:MFS transporter [Flexivirga caeni]|uniref:MFS transporter n=1 Tax=Flexivirga caeni TaxID=2294115 RepID=A0A3M9LX43_9MICO|nr:MFS transporter [Flexivirga caeni]RNI17890.1 MFS transporter [Flexivirga caeni]
MLSPYRSLLAVPGARRFLIGSVVGRLGGAMFGVAVVAMISGRRGSFSLAGAVSAGGLVVLALTASPIGRLVDRFGQRRVAVPLAVWAVVWDVAVVVASMLDAPAWVLFATYGLSAIVTETASLSRTRWAYLLAGQPDRLHTAMSLEQVLDECAFVVGPVIAILLATSVLPEAGFIAAALLYVVGSLVFVSARDSEPKPHPHRAADGRGVARNPAVVVVAIVMVLTGGVFGSNEVVTLAFCGEHGHKDLSGVVLALFALGSGTSAVIFGARELGGSLARALSLGTAAMCVLEVPVLLAHNLVVLAAVLLVAGLATAPTLITSMKLSQLLVPAHQVNESVGLVFTGVVIGVAAGSAIGGSVVQRWGADTAYLVPVVSAAGAALLAALAFPLLRRASPAASQ